MDREELRLDADVVSRDGHTLGKLHRLIVDTDGYRLPTSPSTPGSSAAVSRCGKVGSASTTTVSYPPLPSSARHRTPCA
jgi:hypothetical protein